MNIIVFTYDYPDQQRCTFTFVKQLIDEFARQGNNCCVIAPYSITHNRRLYSFKEIEETDNGGVITILRPNYLSFSNKKIGKFELTSLSRKFAIRRALKKLPFVPDVAYAHFWSSAFEAYGFSRKSNIPLFLATGEDTIRFGQNLRTEELREFVGYISGVICVSSQKKNESISLGLATEEKCIVVPNAFNPKLFFPNDRKSLRKKYGIESEQFIVSFLGTYTQRKGVVRLSDAITALKDSSIHSFFIGGNDEGENLRPKCDGILLEGKVPHSQIPDYLNMSDVFVLPTLSEGCCNAIVEAIGCGLPIISSDREFNYDILDETNSILVNPQDVNEIAAAIKLLKDNAELRNHLSKGSIEKAKRLTIAERASLILKFVKSKM